MTKKFTIPCNFSGQAVMTDFFIGEPAEGQHPINFQAKFLASNKGGIVPQEVMDSMTKIKTLADEHNVSFEDLFIYTLNIANNEQQIENKEFNKILIDADKANKQIAK